MATRLLQLSTAALTGLTCVQVSSSLSSADVATMSQLIANDQVLGSMNLAVPSGTTVQSALVLSGTTSNGANTITSTTVSSPSGGLLSGIVGSTLYGLNIGIPAGTTVVSVSGTTVTMSANATSAAGTGTVFAAGSTLPGSFSQNGQLFVPNRGVVKLFPGDWVAVDSSGFPIVLSANAVAYANSSWKVT